MIGTDEAATLLEKVETAIRNEYEDCMEQVRMDPDSFEEKEMADMYLEDANCYRDIAILMRGGQVEDSYEKFEGQDTAARDYMNDGYINDEEADSVFDLFENYDNGDDDDNF